MQNSEITQVIRKKASPISSENDLKDEIFKLIGDAQFVLLGEASHGTHEFYKYRAEITKRLIEEKNFSAVAVEADFPDAYRINSFVRGEKKARTAIESLSNFQKFPLWMWRNTVVLEFIEWLKNYNDKLTAERRTGFYGIDLYSLHSSIEAVLRYLEKIDPKAAEEARNRYSCFDHFGEDAQQYGYAANLNLSESCEKEVINQLTDLHGRALDYLNRDGFVARDEYFYAEQNARLVKNAEQYYREIYRGSVSSWNLRDRHMAETLSEIAEHLESQNLPPKIVVWAHNSHLGDARATEMSKRGEWNVGQLISEKYRDKVRILGFTTFTGTVTASDNWNEPAQIKTVNAALPNSFENLFHETGIGNFFLNLRNAEIKYILSEPLLERAIGVIYRPQTERASHYLKAFLPKQFDGVIHFDNTKALQPLDKAGSLLPEDLPETYPEGI